jgi:hypothetical protein
MLPGSFTATPRGFTPRNDPANPAFTNSEHPSLNNRGAVAFDAFPISAGVNSPTAIYLEVSGGQSLIPVVKPGDPLFGSTVAAVNLGRTGAPVLRSRPSTAKSKRAANSGCGIGPTASPAPHPMGIISLQFAKRDAARLYHVREGVPECG